MSNVSCIRVLQLNISNNVFLIDSTRVIVTRIVYAKKLGCVIDDTRVVVTGIVYAKKLGYH